MRLDQQQLSLQPQLHPQLLLQLQLQPHPHPQPQLLLLQPQLHPQLPPHPLPLPQQQNRMIIRMMIQQHPPPKPLLFHIKQIPPVRCEAGKRLSLIICRRAQVVSVDALGIYKVLCIVELGLGEKAGLLQPLGQGLPAAADGGL